MGFLEFLKNNYPLKSLSITSTTKRILRDFTIALNAFIQKNPNMPLEQVLQDADFHNKLILQDWTGKKIGGAAPIIPNISDEYKRDIYALLTNIVWSMICVELSYDPTIGTKKDMERVADIVRSYIIEIMENSN